MDLLEQNQLLKLEKKQKEENDTFLKNVFKQLNPKKKDSFSVLQYNKEKDIKFFCVGYYERNSGLSSSCDGNKATKFIYFAIHIQK